MDELQSKDAMPRTGIYATLPLFFLKASYLISGLDDVCMHVVGYLVVFVFSRKKRESWRTSTHLHVLTIAPLLLMIRHSSEFVGMV